MTVDDLLREARQLDRAEREQLLEGIVRLLEEERTGTVPATALCGAGRSMWDGTDAQEYVRQERASWGG